MAAEFGQAAHNLYKGGIQSKAAAKRFAELVRRDHQSVVLEPEENAGKTANVNPKP
jgi:hypothetical protein